MKENNEVVNANKSTEEQTLVERLRIRANIRRNNTERKSVQEGKPDRISGLLDESADRLEAYENHIALCESHIDYQSSTIDRLVEYNKELEGRQESNWISVNDALPELYRECLVYPWISEYILTAELQQDGWNYTEYVPGYGAEVYRLIDGRVTHWKYLEGPKNELE